jgi:hypothetical protein
MVNEWREARRAAQKAALREVAEALGGDDEAYVIAGFLARHNRRDGGQITTVAGLRALAAPENVTGIGVGRAKRIYDWQERQEQQERRAAPRG